MAKGFSHTGDENVKAGEFTSIPDGTYAVNGIEQFISVDEAGDPHYREQRGELKVMLRLRLVDTSLGEGPAMSLTAPEFIGMVFAFGGDFAKEKYKITQANRMSQKTLEMGQALANRAGNKITVITKNGWVNRLPAEATPPEGKYTVQLASVYRPDRKPGSLLFQPVSGINGVNETLLFEFEIIGDGMGKPCVWNGYRIAEWMNNPFVKEAVIDGDIKTAVEIGTPLWAKDERNGGVPNVVMVWNEFIRFFAPDVWDHEWQTDAFESEYGVIEAEEPQYVIVNQALSDKRKVKVWYGITSKRSTRRKIDLRNLPMVNDLPDADEDDEEEAEEVPLAALMEYVELRWPENKIFNADSTFTTEGKAWAQEHLSGEDGPWARAGLDLNDRRLQTLTVEQAERLLNELKSQYPPLTTDTPW